MRESGTCSMIVVPPGSRDPNSFAVQPVVRSGSSSGVSSLLKLG